MADSAKDSFSGLAEVRKLIRVAKQGADGDGKPYVWRFPGCPTFKTFPQRNPAGGWHRPKVSIFKEPDGWVDMGPIPWNNPAYDLSLLPGWHPVHVCGIFCDGQDGTGSLCLSQKMKGPPAKTPIQEFTEGVWSADQHI